MQRAPMDLNERPITSWTIDMLFRDFLGRRAGLIKALTTDFIKFYEQCDPEKPYMCLYGYPNETWEVKEAPVVPHEFPEPSLGVNFAKDEMKLKDWIAHIAIHSDIWIYSYAFYIAARAGFDNETRSRLFNMINSNPTIYEVVFGTVKMPKTLSKSNEGESSSKSGSGLQNLGLPLSLIEKEEEDEDDVELYTMGDDSSSIICGACGNRFAFGESWIFCNMCVTWYHGRCVKTTPERYERLKDYRCPRCCRQKRAGT
ncbi:PHD finger protein ALFIN-LIKE 6-like [Musa acuminata AAA Group]|uniref:PHD finger protein ALFIN-LIKE 6-like n=1 Tax=Musa acuminata AAA Group TaxID=214697 RepID=UPI0031D059F2